MSVREDVQEDRPQASQSARVLIVDDDATALALMRAALKKSGFDVTAASSGQAALDLFEATPFDMVMLDVDMPQMSGYEVCMRLRQLADPLLPIVMVTGLDDVNSVEAAYQSGATDFIAKPFNWALIGHRVKYLMRAREASLALRSANANNAAILRALPDLLFEVDADGLQIAFHSSRTDLLVVPVEHNIGKTIAQVLPANASRVMMAALQTAKETGISTGQQYELQLEHGTCWFELSIARKEVAQGEKPHFIILSRDITERKDAEKKITQLAMFDSLTGLPNRQSFLNRVERETRRAERNGTSFAVLFMDLDGFKNINDTLGHEAGDLALQWAAERLREGVRPTDLVARQDQVAPTDVEIARLGGDEFTALIVDIARAEDAHIVARRILEMIRKPFSLLGREISLSTSIGIAVFRDDGDDALTLLKHADTAMYHAKESGRDNYRFYNASLTEQVIKRMALEREMRAALEHDEFSLHYQPQFDAQSGRICGVEALIRWQHPVRGSVAPGEFIGAAEQSGLIIPIGQWVLATACADAARWQQAGHPVRVAVNLSPAQFKDTHLVQRVTDALKTTGLAPTLLELELTEGVVMQDTVATQQTLQAFKELGVQVTLDDFGTGYSSLSYLKRMPLSCLKIDQSFVAGLPGDAKDQAIVNAILAVARGLGLRVVAEGIETLAQSKTLVSMGCDALQGFYLSRPVPTAVMDLLLAHNTPQQPSGLMAL
jgi:diguanylate cyclase (GGDEF)-like protein/PAS domain S-box-containing protein